MLRVLMADDSMIIRKKTGDILESLGHKVVFAATNGNEAVDAYIKYKPDLVTMDITMPNMNGIDALKYIIKNDKNAKVIMVTSSGQEDLVSKSIQEGAVGYILKPITDEKLAQVIKEVFTRVNKNIKAN